MPANGFCASAKLCTDSSLLRYLPIPSPPIFSTNKSCTVCTGSICLGSPTTTAFCARNNAPTSIWGDACPASSIIMVPNELSDLQLIKNLSTAAKVEEITGTAIINELISAGKIMLRSKFFCNFFLSLNEPQYWLSNCMFFLKASFITTVFCNCKASYSKRSLHSFK